MVDYRGIAIRSLSLILEKNFVEGDVLFLSSNIRDTTPGAPGNWHDQPFVVGLEILKEVNRWLEDHPEDTYDIYFCPMPFRDTTKRKKDKVKSSRLLWSDMDKVTPDQIEKLKPSLLWESSPKSFQGLWILDEEMSPSGAELLNHKLTKFIGGDESGWDLTQVLRLPGTINHKYKELPRVAPFIMETPPRVYKRADIDSLLSDIKIEPKKNDFRGQRVDITGWEKLDHEGVLKKYGKILKGRDVSLIRSKGGMITGGKRSDNIWKIYCACGAACMAPQEIFTVLFHSEWNKWGNKVDFLHQDLTRFYEKTNTAIKKIDVENYDYTPIEQELNPERARQYLSVTPDPEPLPKPESVAKPKLPAPATSKEEPNSPGGLDISPDYIDMSSEDFAAGVPDIYKQSLKLNMEYPDDHFISKYVSLGKKLSDSYQEYHHGAAVALLSIAIGRKAAIVFGSGTVYPNAWCFLVGNSTISRKSTAVGHAKDIATELFGMVALPQSFSPESFIEILSNTPQGWLFKDEVASLLAAMKKNYMGEIRDIFCEVYDNKGFMRKLRSSAKKNATEFHVVDPYIVQYVATTPGSIADNSQTLDLTSGWLLRFLFYYPTYQKEWKPLQEMTKEQAAELAKLKGELKELGQYFWGLNTPMVFTFSLEAEQYFVEWQKHEEISMAKRGDEIESGAYGRLSVYAVKLAMIYTIGAAGFLSRAQEAARRKEKIQIGLQEIKWACSEIENYFMPTVKQVYELIALSDGRNNQKKIIHLLNSHEGYMFRSDLIRKLRCKLRDFNDDIAALTESGEIQESMVLRKGGKSEVMYSKIRESTE